MANTIELANDTANREIVTQKLINAPRELVFEVFTNPKHVINWWGPDGFTNTIHEMEVKPGGVWKLTMHGPDGRDYPNRIVFSEIDPPNSIKFKHVPDDDSERVYHQTIITFEERGSKTLFTLTIIFDTAEEKERVTRENGAVEGGKQTVAKLGAYVEKLSDEISFSVTRELNARREVVFKAWTDPEALAQWWGPKESKITVKQLNLQPGGLFHYGMEMEGQMMWGRFEYKEIIAPERIVFINSFADEQGNIVNNPWESKWPLEIWNVLTLEEQNGKTRLTIKGYPIQGTEAEIRIYKDNFANMEQGFKGTFDKLEEYIANNK